MFWRDIYYLLKPVVPWKIRIGMRNFRARLCRWKNQETWPICQRAALPPRNWPGWPGGKKFAVVLTHDVESSLGVSQTTQLADLEESFGFRSSFNFVPEGYETPADLRSSLVQRGFEVGVHGLKHDGRLYKTREIFRSRALRINSYLKDWGAVGFRSPFMHHNLEWLHDLEVLYDASTFDTDPFEIQPDGAETLFPFWVQHPDGDPTRGYIELPYTLVQDFTLFTILGERTIDLWKRKLDWIVQQGGMVLLNVHPDYVHMGESEAPDGQFRASLYAELLTYIQTKYADQYWHGLPKELAAYCKAFKPIKAEASQKRVCMLAYSHVESDNRILRYATALSQRGDHVDILALATEDSKKTKELYRGLWVNRIQTRIHDEVSKWDYFGRLIKFCSKAAWILAKDRIRHRYDFIHVHNIPDFLVFATIIPRLTGTKILLDVHDIVPEFYSSKFASTQSWILETLKVTEKAACSFAHHVIISNHLWYDRITERSVDRKHCSTFVNYIDLSIFRPRPRASHNRPYTVIFPGGFQWHQGLDLAIEAFQIFRSAVPDAEFHIYGNGDQKEKLLNLVDQLNLRSIVKFFPSVTALEVPNLLAAADLGVVPKRANSFGNEAYSTKIMEFMSQGLPVVVSRTKIDTFYFTDSEVLFFESGNVKALAMCMIRVATDQALRKRLVEAGLAYVQANNWERKQHDYLELIDRLVENTTTFRPQRSAIEPRSSEAFQAPPEHQ